MPKGFYPKKAKGKKSSRKHMMGDREFEVDQYHANRGKRDMFGGKLSKLSVSLGRNK